MKKVTAILVLLVCIVSTNLAFAGNTKVSNDAQQGTTTTQRPRFQR
jgi:hypothetical protein